MPGLPKLGGMNVLMNAMSESGAVEHASEGSDPSTIFLQLFQHVQAHEIFTLSMGSIVIKVTNHTILQIIAASIAFVIFYYVARMGKKFDRPRGTFQNAFESVVFYVRDEMVGKFMTREHADRFMPLFLTFFIFVLFCNLLGLVPIPGISGTATSNVNVTLGLATITLAMMITGIVLSKKAQLSEMSSEIPADAKDKSIEMRLRRWVKHQRIDGDLIYLPFAQQVLSVLSNQELILVMDGSQVGRGCMVLMVGVVYKKRTLPIAWLVYEGKKGQNIVERTVFMSCRIQPYRQRYNQREKQCKNIQKDRHGKSFF